MSFFFVSAVVKIGFRERLGIPYPAE